jgi:hypothetical protein
MNMKKKEKRKCGSYGVGMLPGCSRYVSVNKNTHTHTHTCPFLFSIYIQYIHTHTYIYKGFVTAPLIAQYAYNAKLSLFGPSHYPRYVCVCVCMCVYL